MTDRLAALIMRLSRRERWLLLAALLVALPVGLALGLAQPLNAQRLAAEARMIDAQAQRDWLRLRQGELAELPAAVMAPAQETTVETRPIGLGGIEARLTEAGLRANVAAIAAPSRGEVVIQLQGVRFGNVMRWIEMVEAEAGYELGSLRLRRGDEPGKVSAELQLVPRS